MTELDAAALSALSTWLRKRGLLGSGPITARLAGDGHSNLTYLVGDGSRTVVVRRPPPPPTPPGANDVLREASILRALEGTAVPVPRVLATGEAGEVFDVPFFVMTFAPGPIVTDRAPDGVDGRRLGASLAAVLAGLHAVDWAAAGLRGRPEGSNLRHHDRIARLVADPDGAPPPAFADVDAWLVAHAPAETGAALVHNDFRLGNLVLDPGDPARIAAVLDWELAAVGDPLVDLGYVVAAWAEPGREPATAIERMGTASSAAGFPTREQLIAAYAEASGRSVDGLTWYVVLAEWKLAVLWEYNRRRLEAGSGDPHYRDPAQVTEFLDAARRWIARG
jgi:aminoglycoside phosphotransferase (APT) family kinase protein